MSRYPKGTGKRPNQRTAKKTKAAPPEVAQNPTIEQLKQAEAMQGTGTFEQNMDSIAAEIASKAAENMPSTPVKIEPIEQAQSKVEVIEQTQNEENWQPPSSKQIESFKVLASMACGGVDMVSVSWRKNEAAKMETELREKAEGLLAEIMAIYMPESTTLSPKQLQTLLLVSGLVEVARQHYMRCLTIQPNKSIPAKPEAVDNDAINTARSNL